MSVRKSELNQYDTNAYLASIEPLFLHLWIFEASLQEDYNWLEFVRHKQPVFTNMMALKKFESVITTIFHLAKSILLCHNHRGLAPGI